MTLPAPIENCTPDEAWTGLKDLPGAMLVDVRTRAEWSFVGLPDLSTLNKDPVLAEWTRFPDMSPNPGFLDEVMMAVPQGSEGPIYFLCRSGVRSLHAAHLISGHCAEGGRVLRCVNIAGGFEGDLCPQAGHRGVVNGWKQHGLPWRQS